jgi:hypothetical protein
MLAQTNSRLHWGPGKLRKLRGSLNMDRLSVGLVQIEVALLLVKRQIPDYPITINNHPAIRSVSCSYTRNIVL